MTRTAARAAVLALAGGLTATLTSITGTTATARPAAEEPTGTTRVVLQVLGCDGCSLQAHSYPEDQTDEAWSSPGRKVRDGRVRFRVPTDLTSGMTVSVTAPWERHVGAVSNVVFRYRGQQPGDRVTRQEARAARRGSACFPGTVAPRIELRVRVIRAHFPGVGGPATAPAAYTVVSQPTAGNWDRVHDGFLGSQDLIPCE